MPERKKLSLTEVLAAFSKEASEVPSAIPAEVVAEPTIEQVEATVEKVASEPEAVAQPDAVEALKVIAKEAAESSRATMQKEAQLFGQIFAAAVIEEFEKDAQITAAEQSAYASTLDKVAAEEIGPELQKVAEEAYVMCLVKLAYDEGYAAAAPEQMVQPAAPQMVAPQIQPQVPMEPQSPFVPQAEPEAEPIVVEAPEVEPAPSDGTLVAATEAVQDAAQAAKAVAQAAQAAVEAAAGPSEPAALEQVVGPESELGLEPDGDEAGEPEEVPAELAEELPKVAHQAYELTREYLEKAASDRENMDKLAETLGKIEQEAYDLIMNRG